MWPVDGGDSVVNGQGNGSDADGDEDDVEAQIAKEVAAIKRPKLEKRFGGWCFRCVGLRLMARA